MHDVNLGLELIHARNNIITSKQLFHTTSSPCLLLRRSSVSCPPDIAPLFTSSLLLLSSIGSSMVESESRLEDDSKVLLNVGKLGSKEGDTGMALLGLG